MSSPIRISPRDHRALPALTLAIAALALALASALVGCGDGVHGRSATARAREWTTIATQKRALDVARTALREERARLRSAPVRPDGSAADETTAAVARDVAARERAVAASSHALEERLARFASGFTVRRGERLPPALVAAIHMKSDEDIAIAQEWIERGGDYRHAIAICEAQQRLDPGYAPLAQAIASAREMRAVTRSRFAQVQPGMSTTEVRALLGPVNVNSVVRRPGERVEAWFYPRSGGGVAGVYFRYDARRRAFLVYQSELDAGRVSGSLAALAS